MAYTSKQLNFRVFIKSENSIFLDSPVEFDCQTYFEAILNIVNFSDIVFVGNVLNSQYAVQFFTKELADYVIANYPYLTICNTTVNVRPFSADNLGYSLPKGNVEIDASYVVTENTKIEVSSNSSGVSQNMSNSTSRIISLKDTFVTLKPTEGDVKSQPEPELIDPVQYRCPNGNEDNFISPNMTFSFKNYQQTNQNLSKVFTFNATTSTIISNQNTVHEHAQFIQKRIIASPNRHFQDSGYRNGPRRHIPIRGMEALMPPNFTRGIEVSSRDNRNLINPDKVANFKGRMSLPLTTDSPVGLIPTAAANLYNPTHSLTCKMDATSIHNSTDQVHDYFAHNSEIELFSLRTQNYRRFFNSLYIDFQIIRSIIENPYSCFPFNFDHFIEFLADSYTMPTLEALAEKYNISVFALERLMKNVYSFLPNETVKRIFTRFVNLDKP